MLPFIRFCGKQTLLLVVVCIGCLALLYSSWVKSDQYQQSETAKQPNQVKILSNADLVQSLHYTKCNDEKTVRSKVDQKLIGMDSKEFQKLYPDAVITKFEETEVAITLPVEGYCEEHNATFLGVKDGYVVVYRGIPGNKAIVKEFTPISIKSLLPQDIEELSRGIPVFSNEELLRTLEGMQTR